jgi:hypothetical protein
LNTVADAQGNWAIALFLLLNGEQPARESFRSWAALLL